MSFAAFKTDISTAGKKIKEVAGKVVHEVDVASIKVEHEVEAAAKMVEDEAKDLGDGVKHGAKYVGEKMADLEKQREEQAKIITANLDKDPE